MLCPLSSLEGLLIIQALPQPVRRDGYMSSSFPGLGKFVAYKMETAQNKDVTGGLSTH